MLDTHVDFMIENVNIEHQNVYFNDITILCVLYKSCIFGCYLVKGFDFTQKGFI